MDFGQLVSAWKDLQSHGIATWVALGTLLWTLEKVLEFVGTVTPWRWDDNLGVLLGNLVNRLWKR
jgi:hypothetical protein